MKKIKLNELEIITDQYGRIHIEYIEPFFIENGDYTFTFKKAIEISKKIDLNNKFTLDVGCNTGHLTFLLHSMFKNSRMHGVDIKNKYIDIAQENFVSENLRYSCIDAFAPEFNIEKIDHVMLLGGNFLNRIKQFFKKFQNINEMTIESRECLCVINDLCEQYGYKIKNCWNHPAGWKIFFLGNIKNEK